MRKIKYTNKTVLLLILVTVFCASAVWGQAPLTLDGRTFIITVSSYDAGGKKVVASFPDEINFVNGELHSRKLSKEYNYLADSYSVKADSSQQKNSIYFIAFTKNEQGGIEVFWNGTVTGKTIQGTMNWFSQEMSNTFSGSLKNGDLLK
jgi:hypothetical protein